MSLAEYLQTHFLDKPHFAKLAGLSVDRLVALIGKNAVPAATYRCDGRFIYSAAFGKTPINDGIIGEFFRPECLRWVRLAHGAVPGQERQAVLTVLQQELMEALQPYYPEQRDVEAMIPSYLPYFFDGTFGLCIADPSSGAGIVRKEELQKKLLALTANGTPPFPATVSGTALMELIEQYAESSMPFSPAEYDRSSRKRLVDDLLPQITRFLPGNHSKLEVN